MDFLGVYGLLFRHVHGFFLLSLGNSAVGSSQLGAVDKLLSVQMPLLLPKGRVDKALYSPQVYILNNVGS